MRSVCAFLFILAVSLPARAQTKANPYLKNGRLTQDAEIMVTQSGGVGISGTKIVVKSSGDWSVLEMTIQGNKEIASGTLSKEQTETLAQAFLKYNLAQLPNLNRYNMANPFNVVVRHGTRQVDLVLPGGSTLPRPDEKTVIGRYAGIVQAMEDAARNKKGEKPAEPEKK